MDEEKRKKIRNRESILYCKEKVKKKVDKGCECES